MKTNSHLFRGFANIFLACGLLAFPLRLAELPPISVGTLFGYPMATVYSLAGGGLFLLLFLVFLHRARKEKGSFYPNYREIASEAVTQTLALGSTALLVMSYKAFGKQHSVTVVLLLLGVYLFATCSIVLRANSPNQVSPKLLTYLTTACLCLTLSVLLVDHQQNLQKVYGEGLATLDPQTGFALGALFLLCMALLFHLSGSFAKGQDKKATRKQIIILSLGYGLLTLLLLSLGILGGLTLAGRGPFVGMLPF